MPPSDIGHGGADVRGHRWLAVRRPVGIDRALPGTCAAHLAFSHFTNSHAPVRDVSTTVRSPKARESGVHETTETLSQRHISRGSTTEEAVDAAGSKEILNNCSKSLDVHIPGEE